MKTRILDVTRYTFRHPQSPDSVTVLGPTAAALDELERLSAGVRIIIRTGDPRTGMVTYLIFSHK